MTPEVQIPPAARPPSARPASALYRGVMRNLGWLLAGKGVLGFLSLFYLAIATRSLGVVGFGRFALIIGAAQALAGLVTFQTWQVVVKYGMVPMEAGDEAALSRLYRAGALLDAGSALLGTALAAAILAVWGEAFGIGPTLSRATLIFVVVQLLTIRSTPLGILRLRDEFRLSAVADSVTPAARFVGTVLVALIHPTVQGFLAAWALAELLTAATYWIMVARTGDLALIRRGGAAGEGRGGGGLAMLRGEPGLIRFALSTNASATLGLSAKQVPLLLVGAALGPAAAGTFRLASQIAQALAKLSQLVSRAAFPELVRSVREARAAALRRMMARMLAASTAAGALILGVVALCGDDVLRLVGGPGYVSAYPVLMWMAVAGCLELATVGLETVMTAQGRAGTVFVLRAASVVVTFAAAAWALPVLGTRGMAVAVAAGAASALALMAAAAWAGQPRFSRAAPGEGG